MPLEAAASWQRRRLGSGRPFAATDLVSVGSTALPAPASWPCCAASGGRTAPMTFSLISWARTPEAHFRRKWAFGVRVGGIGNFWLAVPRCRCRPLPVVSQSQVHFKSTKAGGAASGFTSCCLPPRRLFFEILVVCF